MLRSFVEVREAAAAAFSATRAPLCRTPPSTMFPLCLKTPFSLTYASVDQVERNDFLLKDLQVSVDEIADI